jgi:hypothetical protein
MPADIRARQMKLDGRTRQLLTPCDGDSAIIGPDGNFLAGPALNEETILTAKGNTGTVMLQKMIADHAGHYSRPDVFEFRVNTTRKQPVRFTASSSLDDPFGAVRTAIADGAIRDESALRGAFGDAVPEFIPAGSST